MHRPEGERDAPDDRLVPFRRLAPWAPFRWLRLGLADLRAAPGISTLFGLTAVAVSAALAALFFALGGAVALLAGLSAFVFGGPLLAVACYEVPRARRAGRRPGLRGALRLARQTLGEAMVLAILLLVVALLWIRAASLVHVFYPAAEAEGIGGLLTFLAIGSAVGALFLAALFAASAFSLPLVAERRVAMVIAVLSSVRAVLANPGASLVWAIAIVALSVLSIALALIGLALVVPWLGYATFHAAREALAAEDWPLREMGDPASPDGCAGR